MRVSQHKAHGRRRAPASLQPADPVATRHGQRYRTSARQPWIGAASFGAVGQKAAMVVATSGLAMTVIVPATAAVSSDEAGGEATAGRHSASASGPAETVTAASSAAVNFDRTDLRSSFDPEAKLHQVMLSSDGELEPASTEGTLAAPIASANRTSGFGYRVSPITGYAGELHTGQDFGASCGTPVLAAADGVVVEAGWQASGGGNRIVVDHGDGLETTYNHLSSIDVRVGQSLARGDRVAAAGTTGASTGCHLHFEVVVNGKTIDPLGWL